jgi:hypothetical protein
LRGPAIIGLCAGLLVGLSGCFESDEERATAAYEAHDFATAASLAEGLAKDGEAYGYQLLALMAAQGLGRPIDFAEAYDMAAKAQALDPAYAGAREDVEARVNATAAAAQAAFEREDFERARALAEPLAVLGHAGAIALRRQLITGHFVALPESEMSWRDFWHSCSGNTRHESDANSEAAFGADCRGRKVVWDGTVVGVVKDGIKVKMSPGRPGARHDLMLVPAVRTEEPVETRAPVIAKPGRKVRFSAVIDSRGTPARADKLIDAVLIGDAPLSDRELARGDVKKLRAAMAACQKLAEAKFRASYMPEWAIEIEKKVRAGGSPGSRAFSLFVGVVSEADAFKPTEDGGWHGLWDGTVTIQSVVARTAQVTKFKADCTVAATFKRGLPLEEHAALEFVSISEPKVDSAPGRLQTPGQGD